MEVISSLIPANTPSPVILFKFAITQFLTSIRSMLFLYPVNLLIFIMIIYLVLRSIVKRFTKKSPFEANYKL